MRVGPLAGGDSLAGTVRAATAGELAALYAALAADGAGGAVDAVVPTVAFTFGGHEGAGRLRQFGVQVVTVDGAGLPSPATFLLGGPLHGWCVVDVADLGAHVEAVAALVERERLRTWAGLLDGAPEPVFTRTHKPGSDSTGVVQFRTDRDVVAKIGPRTLIETEADFLRSGNEWLRKVDQPPLFPDLYAVHVEGGQAASLMEAAEPAELTEQLFTDARRTELRDDALAVLAPFVDRLSTWHRLTVGDRRPTVGDYLYRERYLVLPEFPAFTATFASLLPGVDLRGLLARDVALPGGRRLWSWDAAVRWLEDTSPDFLPAAGSAVHGDIGITNMLRRADGSPVLIDPRTVWEGRDRPDVGYGDPVFDLATLVHTMLPMAAVLDAVARGATDELFGGEVDPHGDPLDLSGLSLPLRFPAPLSEVERRLVEVTPTGEPERVVRTRLSIGAATSLAGWLKYERSMRTKEGWLATYAYALWYLARARAVWEGRPDPDDVGSDL